MTNIICNVKKENKERKTVYNLKMKNCKKLTSLIFQFWIIWIFHDYLNFMNKIWTLKLKERKMLIVKFIY